jgi:hypothetical protein
MESFWYRIGFVVVTFMFSIGLGVADGLLHDWLGVMAMAALFVSGLFQLRDALRLRRTDRATDPHQQG